MMVDAAKNFIYDFQLFCDATGGEFTDENMDKKINILYYLLFTSCYNKQIYFL